MPSGRGDLPQSSGQVYDRPQYPDSISLQSLIEYRYAHLQFADAYRDATRHDQNQLYDAMAARFHDFMGHALAQLRTEGIELVKSLKAEILAADLNRGTMRVRETKMENVANTLEYCLIEKGYFMAKRKPVFAPFDLPR